MGLYLTIKSKVNDRKVYIYRVEDGHFLVFHDCLGELPGEFDFIATNDEYWASINLATGYVAGEFTLR